MSKFIVEVLLKSEEVIKFYLYTNSEEEEVERILLTNPIDSFLVQFEGSKEFSILNCFSIERILSITDFYASKNLKVDEGDKESNIQKEVKKKKFTFNLTFLDGLRTGYYLYASDEKDIVKYFSYDVDSIQFVPVNRLNVEAVEYINSSCIQRISHIFEVKEEDS